ncbi:MAG: sigma factor G inhibitor Gin [Clostridium sp.]|nr:sigma factor G inhibitor Gin [Clostridium sp.]
MKEKICIICGKHQSNGIIINGKCICRTCEKRLIKLDVSGDFYEHYIKCIKKNLVQVKAGEDKWQNYQL